MAYGDDNVTLATYDSNIPDKVFVEVISITLEQFRLLRDGGIYTDSETGEENEDIVHNFRQLDALTYAQNGTLQEKLDELFGK